MHLAPLDWKRVAAATPSDPLRVLTSACLVGRPTGWQGTAYTDELVLRLTHAARVRPLSFCPEEPGLGTPRPFTTIHGGDGFAVLDGRARVIDTDGRDCTEAIVTGARAMCELALRERVELCVTLDVSDSCGSNVVYLGRPEEKRYQQGVGVAVATLIRAGFAVLSQRDARTLGTIVAALDPTFAPREDAIDFVENDWYRSYFAAP